MDVPNRPKSSHIHKGSRRFSSLHHLPTPCLFIFSREHFLSSSILEASPSAPIHLRPLCHRPFVSRHLRHRQHLWPSPQHLRLASPSLRVTTFGHGSVSHHLLWHQHLRPWSCLASTPSSWCVYRHLYCV